MMYSEKSDLGYDFIGSNSLAMQNLIAMGHLTLMPPEEDSQECLPYSQDAAVLFQLIF